MAKLKKARQTQSGGREVLKQAAASYHGNDRSGFIRETAAQKKQREYTPAERRLAILGVFLIIVLLLLLIHLSFSGGSPQAILAVLFCVMIIPCIFYAFRLYVSYTVAKKEKTNKKR